MEKVTNVKLNEGSFFNTVTYNQGGWVQLRIFETLSRAKKLVDYLKQQEKK